MKLGKSSQKNHEMLKAVYRYNILKKKALEKLNHR